MKPRQSVDEHVGHLIELSGSMLRDVVGAIERINDINRTIHILSMNARVEAARAGEAGRGFTVVAQELTRLSAQTETTAHEVQAAARRTSAELGELAAGLREEVRDNRLCDLALHAMDLVDRNLYERSCDVRWWATDSSLVDCAAEPSPARVDHACRRLGQILDSYTVYADLLLAGPDGRILANGRRMRWPGTVGSRVGDRAWFQGARQQRTGAEYVQEPLHAEPLVGGDRALVFGCAVRAGGAVDGAVLGVLGIVFRWDALGPKLMQDLPLSEAERRRTRAMIVDDQGEVLADADPARIGQRLPPDWLAGLRRGPRGATPVRVGGREARACHASSPGFETYRSGWHGLLLAEAG